MTEINEIELKNYKNNEIKYFHLSDSEKSLIKLTKRKK